MSDPVCPSARRLWPGTFRVVLRALLFAAAWARLLDGRRPAPDFLWWASAFLVVILPLAAGIRVVGWSLRRFFS